MNREPLKKEQLQALGRVAGNMVATMQERFTPSEAVSMLSMALQMVICASTTARVEAHALVDRITGDLHSAVNTNLPPDRKNDEVRSNGVGHG